jgi:hypothetical protein
MFPERSLYRKLIPGVRSDKMKYYFDMIGPRCQMDAEGAEFANEAGARQEAQLRALNSHQSHRLQSYNGFASITVRNEAGRTICKVPIEH